MAARIVFYIFAASAFFFIDSNALSDHDHKPGVKFTYKGDAPPEKWGSLSPEYSTCSTGKSQSPIDIAQVVINKNFKPLTVEYSAINSTLANHGFNIGIRYGNNSGFMNIDGKNYVLKQVHWHTPSEHTINGVQYAAELHMFHIADDGSMGVVAILYELGRPDPLLSTIQPELAKLANKVRDAEARISLEGLDTKKVRKSTREYYRYIGSLTTPPCTENVLWHVLGKVRTISKEQIEALKAPVGENFKENARPVQPLNGRTVEKYIQLPKTKPKATTKL